MPDATTHERDSMNSIVFIGGGNMAGALIAEVAKMVGAVKAMGLETCATLGMLKPEQAPAPDGAPRGLSKGEREMIIVATSGANHCLYCVVAHGAILRIYEKKPLLADQLAVNHRKADISPRQRAMLDFAMKVCLDSAAIEEADFDALRTHGFSDEDIWDIGAITAFFGLSNRMANLSAMRPNDEFYLMGRVPRSKG